MTYRTLQNAAVVFRTSGVQCLNVLNVIIHEHKDAMIHFRLEPRSGVPAYRQLYDQVRQAVSLGHLKPGDQLPPVREVVRQITLNPNTVHARIEISRQRESSRHARVAELSW